jgi:hypothetical protein
MLPVGQKLYDGSMQLRDVLLPHGFSLLLPGTSSPTPPPARFVVEAFPKLFLALLRDPKQCSVEAFARLDVQRNMRDSLMANELFAKSDTLARRLAQLGLQLETPPHHVLADRDIVAAYVCGLSAVFLRLGLGGLLGDPTWGAFSTPHSTLWHPDWQPRVRSALVAGCAYQDLP